jgi:hypothetical protein
MIQIFPQDIPHITTLDEDTEFDRNDFVHICNNVVAEIPLFILFVD